MEIKKAIRLLLIVFSMVFLGCENALNSSLIESGNEAGTERTTITAEEADLYNLGRGYNSSTHENIGRAFDWSTGKTQASDAIDSTCGPRTYSFIARSSKDVRELTSSDFDMGVSVSYGPLDVEASFSKEMFNSLEFSSNSLTMIVRCDYVKKIISLDSMVFKQEALDLFNERGKEGFRSYYGDRYLQEVRIGGVLNFICKLETSSSSSVSKDKMEAALNVSYDTVFLDTDLSVSYKRYNITEEEYRSMRITIFTFHNGTTVKSFVTNYAEFKEISENFDNDMNSGNHVIRTKKYSKYPFFDQPNEDYYSYMNLWMDYRDFVRDAGNLANRRIDAGIGTQEDRDMAFDCLILLPEINKNISKFNYVNEQEIVLDYSEKVRKFFEYTRNISELVVIDPVLSVPENRLSTGISHTMILKEDGTLWGAGNNNRGQLGDGTNINRTSPVQIMSDVKFVSAGQYHTMIIKNDGTLWGTGKNSLGQLGDGTTTNRNFPVQIMKDVKTVSTGYNHTMVIKKDCSLWGTGLNRQGQLGDGTTTNRTSPVRIINNVKSVSVGSSHTMIMKNDNSVWGTGSNSIGQLGDGTRISRTSPAQIMEDVKSVVAGYGNTMIIKNDDTLWGVGDNERGQLGIYSGTGISPILIMHDVKSIITSMSKTMIIKNNDALWGTTNDFSFERIMENVKSASFSDTHTLIIKNDGTLWGTGFNHYGQLGDGTITDRTSPVMIMSL